MMNQKILKAYGDLLVQAKVFVKHMRRVQHRHIMRRKIRRMVRS